MDGGPQKLRVAVATGDGGRVDQHFARSRFFDVYEVDADRYTFFERRENPSGRCDCDGSHRDKAFAEICDLIKDCRFVVALRIGEGAITHLVDRAIRAAQIDDTVDGALRQLIESGKFKTALRRKG
jgi:predicted Fe-Mo cluster-binding NifX family protein